MAIEIKAMFTTRNTTYVVAQGDTGQYIGRFGTEAVSLYVAESGVAEPKEGQQAVLNVLDHHGRYDRLLTSRVQCVALWEGQMLEIAVFIAASDEIQQVLSFAERCEAKTAAKYAAQRRLAPAL